MSDLQPKSYRPATEYTFPVPASLSQELGGYTSMTLRELLPSMESRAVAQAGQDAASLQQALLKLSLVRAQRADGSKFVMSSADDSVDRFITEIGPKGRALLTIAYGKISTPDRDELSFFLDGVQASVI